MGFGEFWVGMNLGMLAGEQPPSDGGGEGGGTGCGSCLGCLVAVVALIVVIFAGKALADFLISATGNVFYGAAVFVVALAVVALAAILINAAVKSRRP